MSQVATGCGEAATILNNETIASVIRRRAELRPDQPAVFHSSLAPLTCGELQCLVEEIRANLRLAGLNRNARVVVAIPSAPHAALAIVAIACSAVAVPLNPMQPTAEFEKSLTTIRPDAVFLLQGDESAARQVARSRALTIIEAKKANGGKLGLKTIMLQERVVTSFDEPDPDAPAFILHTSGTIAEPKLIPFRHRNMLAAAARLQAWFKLTEQDRCLSVSPVYYSHGLKVTVLTPLLTGGTVAFPTDPSILDSSEWFGALKPTWYSAGPTLHRLVLDQTRSMASARTMHSLRFIVSGGAQLPKGILADLQHTLGVPVLEHYGSSEAAQIAANLPSPGASKIGTCGVPWPGTVIIVGEDGRRLAAGEQGEVLVGGATVISGYLNAPSLNRSTFVDGWLKTGDVGSLDNEGFLTIHGRKDDLINRGSEKIWPNEIEDTLARHPAVAESAAFALRHPRLGEDIAAAVVLKSGMTATPVELRAYLGKLLASFKVPRRIVILDELPKGLTGKVLRRELTESFGTTVAVQPSAANANCADSGNLVSQLTELWERTLNLAPLSIDDDFFEKGGDSLLAVAMLADVERITGQAVPTSFAFEAPTIRQLSQKLTRGDSPRPKSSVQVLSNGGKTPLIFFHGDYEGNGFYTNRLQRLLGSDYPLMTIAPHGVDGKPFPPTIEAMAADRVALIKGVQPQGPYRLGGFCLGGLVAFELARILMAAGEKVEMVAMIDPPTVNARRSVQTLLAILNRARPLAGSFTDRLAAWTWMRLTNFENLGVKTRAERWAWVKAKVRAFVVQREHQAKDDLSWKYAAVMSRYFPVALSVAAFYFSAEYDGEPWRQISADLEVVKLSGSGHRWVTVNPTDLADRLLVLLRGMGETIHN